MLTEKKATVAEERSTKQPLSTAEVKDLLAGVETVVIARGRRVDRVPARKVKPADLKGPTGGFRAPMLQLRQDAPGRLRPREPGGAARADASHPAGSAPGGRLVLRIRTMPDDLAARGAAVLARAFDTYCDAFAAITARAPRRFARRDWHGMQCDALERLELYSKVLDVAIADLVRHLAGTTHSKATWSAMKEEFAALIGGRGDFELAETFFSSASRRIFTTVGVDPRVEFVAPTASSLLRIPGAPVYTAYPPAADTAATLARILEERAVEAPFEDLERDCRRAAERIEARLGGSFAAAGVEAIDAVRPLFYRNKGAYLVGRIFSGADAHPAGLALIHTRRAGSSSIAVLLDEDERQHRLQLHPLLLPRRRRAALRDWCASSSASCPRKPLAELYISIGYNKHGKTELYRDLLRPPRQTRTSRSSSRRGDEGMVMLVFTMPSLRHRLQADQGPLRLPEDGDRAGR